MQYYEHRSNPEIQEWLVQVEKSVSVFEGQAHETEMTSLLLEGWPSRWKEENSSVQPMERAPVAHLPGIDLRLTSHS